MYHLESPGAGKVHKDSDKEIEEGVQMIVLQVASEHPPPFPEEFPDGTKVFFLGECAYGVAGQVASTTDNTLSVIIGFSPSETTENAKFKAIVQNRASPHYYPSSKVANMLQISDRALSMITSSFMVLTSDLSQNNLGLGLRFEVKDSKAVDYSRKRGSRWEFSEKTINLIREYKEKFPKVFRVLDQNINGMARAPDVFDVNADARVKEIGAWLKSKGIYEFGPVSLPPGQLTKETVAEIEAYTNDIIKNRPSNAIKKALVKNVPHHAVIKPAHAIYRLQNQRFALGDRVRMVQDSAGVPLSVGGVVIGLNSDSIDVVWDISFPVGVTLGDRCSRYRGSTVQFNSCLNLSNPQFIASTHPPSAPPPRPILPFKPRLGLYPAARPPSCQPTAGASQPVPQRQLPAPVNIMTDSKRGSGTDLSKGATTWSSGDQVSNDAPGRYGNRGDSTGRSATDPQVRADPDNLPNSEIFDPGREVCHRDDATSLSRRCDSATANNTTPSVTINNNFKELASVLRADGRNIQKSARVSVPSVMKSPPKAVLVPKMSLQTFCDRFELSTTIMTKLDGMKITGPHGLRFVTDEQFFEKGQLDVGELADVRDAQERWLYEVD